MTQIGLLIEQPQKPTMEFLYTQTEESLITDIKTILRYMNSSVNLTRQKDRVEAIHFHIKRMFETYKYELVSLEIIKLLENSKLFIIIINKSIDNFAIQVQLIFNHTLYKIQI